MLAAASVSQTGKLTLWWSQAGKTGVSWSRIVQHLGPHLPTGARVTAAHVTCAVNNAVRVALVIASDPAAAVLLEVRFDRKAITGALWFTMSTNYLCAARYLSTGPPPCMIPAFSPSLQISGSPRIHQQQGSGAPASHRMTVRHLGTVSISAPNTASIEFPPRIIELKLLPLGTSLAILGGSTSTVAAASGVTGVTGQHLAPPKIFLYRQQPQPFQHHIHLSISGGSGPPAVAWESVAAYSAVDPPSSASSATTRSAESPPAGLMEASFASSEDGSKLVVLSAYGNAIHVLDAQSQSLAPILVSTSQVWRCGG